MRKKKVLISGSRGRVGRELVALLGDHHVLELGGEVDRHSEHKSFLGLKDIDVAIDFSSLALFREALKWAVESRTPFVSGTTGLSDSDRKALEGAARTIPVLWSANMSLGVNLLLELFGKLKFLSDYDFQVEEFHHRHKVDHPSGTALLLQEKLEEVLERKLPEPLSGRGGGIFGIHKIYMMAEEEFLVFEHTALNRRIFARGALSCASWLLDQKPGLYKVRDMMEFGG